MKQSDKIIIGLTIICCIIMLICVFTSSGVEENRECGTVEVVENNEDVGVEEKSYSIVIKNSKELEQELYKIYGIEFVVYEEEKVNDIDFSTYTYYYVHPKNNSNLRFKIKDNEINKSVYYFSLACMDLNDYLENGKRTYIKEIDWWEEIPAIEGLTVLPVVYDCDDVYPNEYQGHAGNHLGYFDDSPYSCICLIDKEVDRDESIQKIVDRLHSVADELDIEVGFVSKEEIERIKKDYKNKEYVYLANEKYGIKERGDFLRIIQNGFPSDPKIQVERDVGYGIAVDTYSIEEYINKKD